MEKRTHLNYDNVWNDSYNGIDLSMFQVENKQKDENGQYNSKSRPVSFYDNFKDTLTMTSGIKSFKNVENLNESSTIASQPLNENNYSSEVKGSVITIQGNKKRMENSIKSPSMATSITTTVPVNLAAPQISGRHTPTRNSLRHSRMIVMHRCGSMSNKFKSLILRHRKTAVNLATLKTIFGIIITSISLFLLLWAPNLPSMDNPFWSGIPLLFSGIFTICLLYCFKNEYSSTNPGFCLKSSEVVSMILSSLAIITCFTVFITSTLHLKQLMNLECSPAHVINATCVCRERSEMTSPSEPILEYIDLSCSEVEGIFTIFLIFSIICNAFGTIISSWYCYLYWNTCTKRPKYVNVRDNMRSMTNDTNSRTINDSNLRRR